MNSSIGERIAKLRSSLPSYVRLIAVSKYVPTSAMRSAYAAGVRDFGESRIQEAIAKISELHDLPDITWHFIGSLQSNKAKKALLHFDWIHSVDSLPLTQRLDQLASQLEISPKICLQVKILPDPHKSGWELPQFLADLPEINLCKNLQIQGLMTIPPLGLNKSEALDVFNCTKKLAQEINQQKLIGHQIEQLSMGMSGDYELAVQAGATMVRLGTIVFGDRSL